MYECKLKLLYEADIYLSGKIITFSFYEGSIYRFSTEGKILWYDQNNEVLSGTSLFGWKDYRTDLEDVQTIIRSMNRFRSLEHQRTQVSDILIEPEE
ncbi:MAG: hypothetical protein WC877_00405 [Dehalococcoidales bacterium]|jgi:hypothetical protein